MGAPVLPEVKVTLAVPAGKTTGTAGNRAKATVSPATSTGSQGRAGHCCASEAATTNVSTPAARSA